MRELLVALPALERTIFLAELIGAFVFFLLLRRPSRVAEIPAETRSEPLCRFVRGFTGMALALWAYLILESFWLAAPLQAAVGRILGARLSIGEIGISLGDVLVLVVTIWLTFKLARLIDFVLTEDVFQRANLPRGVPCAISTLTRYSLIVIDFMFALAAAGIELSKLTIVAGGLSVGIGFGMQNIVNNFVSGLILLFERPLKVGNDIQLGGAAGRSGTSVSGRAGSGPTTGLRSSCRTPS